MINHYEFIRHISLYFWPKCYRLRIRTLPFFPWLPKWRFSLPIPDLHIKGWITIRGRIETTSQCGIRLDRRIYSMHYADSSSRNKIPVSLFFFNIQMTWQWNVPTYIRMCVGDIYIKVIGLKSKYWRTYLCKFES